MTAVLGVVAALSAPLLMTFGFYIWDGLWNGSALGLNIYKGSLATAVFLITIGCINLSTGQYYLQHGGSVVDLGWILLSGLIGITIGDTCWLQAMSMLGARRVIVVDVTKPFLAALVGFIGLGEPVTPLLFVGLFLTMSGVGLVSFEMSPPPQKEKEIEKETEKEIEKEIEKGKEKEEMSLSGSETGKKGATTGDKVHKAIELVVGKEDASSLSTTSLSLSSASSTLSKSSCFPSQYALGYLFACFNVLFDVFGSFLTRRFGTKLTTFDINAVRFGSASFTLMLVGGAARGCCVSRNSVLGQELYGKPNWWHSMTKKTWALVSCGVLFVTVLCPALSNWALFQLPLSVCLCLTSVSPLYAIPMAYFVKKEQITWRAVVGSILAIVGVVVLQFS